MIRTKQDRLKDGAKNAFSLSSDLVENKNVCLDLYCRASTWAILKALLVSNLSNYNL